MMRHRFAILWLGLAGLLAAAHVGAGGWYWLRANRHAAAAEQRLADARERIAAELKRLGDRADGASTAIAAAQAELRAAAGQADADMAAAARNAGTPKSEPFSSIEQARAAFQARADKLAGQVTAAEQGCRAAAERVPPAVEAEQPAVPPERVRVALAGVAARVQTVLAAADTFAAELARARRRVDEGASAARDDAHRNLRAVEEAGRLKLARENMERWKKAGADRAERARQELGMSREAIGRTVAAECAQMVDRAAKLADPDDADCARCEAERKARVLRHTAAQARCGLDCTLADALRDVDDMPRQFTAAVGAPAPAGLLGELGKALDGEKARLRKDHKDAVAAAEGAISPALADALGRIAVAARRPQLGTVLVLVLGTEDLVKKHDAGALADQLRRFVERNAGKLGRDSIQLVGKRGNGRDAGATWQRGDKLAFAPDAVYALRQFGECFNAGHYHREQLLKRLGKSEKLLTIIIWASDESPDAHSENQSIAREIQNRPTHLVWLQGKDSAAADSAKALALRFEKRLRTVRGSAGLADGMQQFVDQELK